MRKLVALLALAAIATVAVPVATAAAQSNKNRVINVGIVGGTAAAPGQFPWIVGLVTHGEPNAYDALFCGGTVIAPRVVITAAHCTIDESPETMEVVVGRTRMSQGRIGKRVAVSAIFNHPGYDGNRYTNDIALVQLAEPVDVTPIRLPRLEDAPLINPAARTTSSGWGATTEGGSKSDDLLYVRLTVRSMSTCARRYQRRFGTDIRTQVCVGGKRGEDTCQGDSGGPLFAGQGVTAVLLGLVSYGDGCARENVPGMYTRVAGYSKWVRDNAALLNGDTPSPPPEPGEPPRVRVGAIQCGAVMCRVRLSVTGRAPEGGILVNVTRRKTKRRPAVDRSVYARELSPGIWEARVNLPVGRVRLRAFPLNDTQDQVDGRGAVEQLRITQG
jgi:trypsin